jgi:signal transduction histidine kinase/CheY-like chemotaxis protein/HPt (histidine-containing phosphotransfer) domain-containing protein
VGRPRWLVLYFVLAAVCIGTIASSVAITFHLAGEFSASQHVTAQWQGRSLQYGRIADFAAIADQTSSDVFDTGDAPKELEKLDSAVDRFRVELAAARVDLKQNVPPVEAATLFPHLDVMEESMDNMAIQGQWFFSHFQSGRSALAAKRMAAMGRSYETLNLEFRALDMSVDGIERQHSAQQVAVIDEMRKYEYAIALGAMVVVLGLVLYGRRLLNHANRISDTREQDLAALRASEEKFRTLSEQLEHRVEERTAELSSAMGSLQESEQRMRETETQFTEAQRLTHVGSWGYTIATNTVTWSDETYRQLGLEPRSVAPSFDLFVATLHPDDRDRIVAWVQEAGETGVMRSTEGRYLLPNGVTRTFRFGGDMKQDENGTSTHMMGTTQDITAQKEADAALHAARVAAEAANRSKSDFLANMSHEIRTPMNGVLGMLELTLDTDLDPTQRDNLQIAQSSAESLLDIINDILDFSKIEAGKFELDPAPFALSEHLSDTMNALAVRAHGKGLELALQIHPDVPDDLVGDLGRLRQVIVNLAGNAVKFTEEGEVVLRIDVESRDAAGVRLHFAVSDTGIGIPKDKQHAVFEAFQQADTSITREFGGTGLGLAISSRIVALMGGRIWVESEPGLGSTFHFTSAFGLAPIATKDDAATDAADMRGLTVLVVDDNATNLSILEQMLRGWNMVPTLAASGREALEILVDAHARGSAFPLVLTDVDMPRMDGFAFVDAIRKTPALAAMGVVMLSSVRHMDEVRRYREVGVSGYLTKPVRRSLLKHAITTALGGTPTHGNVRRKATPAVRLVRRSLRVLLAEDHPVNQRITRSFLERDGHSVHVVANGAEAVRAAESERFDAILMDVQMPEMGGFEATRTIRASTVAGLSNVPIIALTARAMKGDREACIEAGMNSYLSKPVRAEDLSAALDSFARTNGESAIRSAARPTESVADEPAPHTPAIDEAGILKMVGGNRKLLAEMVVLFLQDYPKRIAEITGALDRNDAEALEFAAHAVKGAALTLCARRVADSALAIEKMGRAAEMESVGGALAALERELAHGHAGLTRIVAVV